MIVSDCAFKGAISLSGSIRRRRVSSNNPVDNATSNARQSKVATTKAIGEFLVLNAKQMEHCRVDVVHLDDVLFGIVSEFVGGASVVKKSPPTRKALRERA